MKPLRLTSLPEAMRAEIRRTRRAKGMSQRELGKRSHLAQKHVSQIETGKIVPQFNTLLDLVRCLDLDVVIVPQALTPVIDNLARTERDRGEGAGRVSLYAVSDSEDEELD